MRSYLAPDTCSTGIHTLLEALELPFKGWIGEVPADYPAICCGPAWRHPQRKLLREEDCR